MYRSMVLKSIVWTQIWALLTDPWVVVFRGCRSVAGDGEHGEGDEGSRWSRIRTRPGVMSPDLRVDGLDASVGEAVLDRGEDSVAVFHDAALQLHEYGDPGSACPA